VEGGIVMAQLQRRGVREAARLGDLALRQRPARHRRLDRLAGRARRLGGQPELDLAVPRDRPRRPGENLAEDIERVVAIGHAAAAQALPTTLSGRSLPNTR
jgi:hypothetical protein